MWNAEWKRDPRARRASINFAFRIPHSALEVSMPSPLVECVPNFSEGRNAATIEALRLALTSVPGVRLLDVQSDAAHNRSVFTFVAPPDPSVEAALAAMRVATERIDLSHHTGEHPRMGATDVVPFVPVRDATMDDCVALARRLAERAAADLQIPIYLYAKAATRPERERLPDVRKGEFEGLRERIGKDPAADPDFGPKRIHPTAGATAIGARPFLVAFNIYLDTSDVALAKDIARRIRTSSGGLPAVQASGFDVAGKAQVSMNLLDIDVTSPATVFTAVAAAAGQRGVPVAEGRSPPGAGRGRGARRSGPDAARDGPRCRAPGRAGARGRADREQERALRRECRGCAGPRGARGGGGERQGERGVAVGAGAREVAARGGGQIGAGCRRTVGAQHA